MLIPIPVFDETEVPVREESDDKTLSTPEFREWWFCKDWPCPICQAVMFGRMTYCVYCKQRLRRDTPRPPDYC